ncbi:DUF1837 domain-containing protein [Helicobacter muridarum]|uniref:DUF1837 domain-containing protein n=1 Tax=Helicobacter muridarum TaxID=216 RepID=A0A099TY51_9HELI|nr:DUF1837 domain-containing protein [Helicobacter muridarum]TLD99921.1 DUF1837 domain-containing protein [Helicobacter muridarum]STQ86835.1 Domain of uncharacterised function (DUF1837) [Helicobacter muridarum]
MNDYTFTKYKDKDKVDFEVLIDEWLINTSANHAMLSLVNDFESNQWRSKKFRNFIINNLKEVALNKKERDALSGNEGDILERAISKMHIDNLGGEIGEVFLYGIMKNYYNALPVVPKIFYKQNPNDNAKGADSVHITLEENAYHIWLGESKIYSDITRAISEVVESVYELLATDKLKKEKSLITNLNDIDGYLSDSNNLHKTSITELKNILNDRTSLDEMKKILHIPISIIYECDITKQHLQNYPVCLDNNYKNLIIELHRNQCSKLSQKIISKLNDIPLIEYIKFHIMVFPIPNKKELVAQINKIFEAHRQ